MIPELGHFALLLALCLSIALSVVPMIGAYRNQLDWMKIAQPLAIGQFIFISFAFLALTYSFITNDFTVRYVAENSNSLLPLIYRICAVWGAHEGSLLLWVFMLSAWTFVLSISCKQLSPSFKARSLAILGLISFGFLLFLLLTSNPFDRIFLNTPLDGRDLNPLLQDPGLVSHPPMLYMGYVGFAIPFAFALTALMEKTSQKAWVSYAKPFTLLAWSFLTLGIVLGSWWAYRQLGWGGWWFWDPVENASFMPWLAGTILIHSFIVIEKRGLFQSWGILMSIIAFSLSLLGTFIVRSGVLISVHSFAVDPKRGLFILVFLSLVVGSSLMLYAMRGRYIQSKEHFDFFSRETFLLINNAGLLTALITVFLGTLYPLIIQTLGLGKLSVGAPYFNKTFGLLMLPLLCLMAIAPVIHWRQDRFLRVWKKIRFILLLSLLVGLLIPWVITHEFNAFSFIALTLFSWIIGCLFFTIPIRLNNMGMLLAHTGIAVCLLGIVFSIVYDETQDIRMSAGDKFSMAGYQFKLLDVHDLAGANYKSSEASVAVSKEGKSIALLKPQLRLYTVQNMALPKAAIHANPLRDVYVVLSEPIHHNAWAIRFYYKPLIRWIWTGGLLILLGGLFAAFRGFQFSLLKSD